jgi:hypothetical protein
MEQNKLCNGCKKEKPISELVEGSCPKCRDWRKRAKIEIRVIKEREARHLCKWCGEKIVNQPDWANTCDKCGGEKTQEYRNKIFNESIDKKKKENPNWYKQISK